MLLPYTIYRGGDMGAGRTWGWGDNMGVGDSMRAGGHGDREDKGEGEGTSGPGCLYRTNHCALIRRYTDHHPDICWQRHSIENLHEVLSTYSENFRVHGRAIGHGWLI